LYLWLIYAECLRENRRKKCFRLPDEKFLGLVTHCASGFLAAGDGTRLLRRFVDKCARTVARRARKDRLVRELLECHAERLVYDEDLAKRVRSEER
jgi:hypothetical protein